VRAGAACGARLQRAAKAIEPPVRALLGAQGLFARTWPSGAMAFGMMLFLVALLLAYYAF
jgi:hypothetical protein